MTANNAADHRDRIPIPALADTGQPVTANSFGLGWLVCFLLPRIAGVASQDFADRFLATVLFILLSAQFTVIVAFPFLPLSDLGRWTYLALVIPMTACVAGVALLFRMRGQRLFCTNLLLLMLMVSLFACATWLGGMRSPVLVCLLSAPLLARTMLDRKATCVWTALVFIGFCALALAEVFGYQFQPMTAPGAAVPLALALTYCVTLLLIYLVGDIYVATIAGLRERVTREAERQTFLAGHDELTGIANRRNFFAVSGDWLRGDGRRGQSFALLVIDLTGFKEVNDRFGHAAGDSVLIEYAQRLRNCLRGSDFVARLGGDEFAVLLDEVCDEASLERALRGVRASLSEPMRVGARTLDVSAAIGAAIYPQHGRELRALVRAADIAMYAAKRAGLSQLLFNPTLEQSMQESA